MKDRHRLSLPDTARVVLFPQATLQTRAMQVIWAAQLCVAGG